MRTCKRFEFNALWYNFVVKLSILPKLNSLMIVRHSITVIILGMLLLTSCDSTVNIKGVAYNWTDEPLDSKGLIINNEKPLAEYSLTSIKGAKVNILYGVTTEKLESINKYTGPNADEGILITDDKGVFVGHWLDGFEGGYIKVVVEKEGFYSTEQVLKYDVTKANDFNLLILMVQKP